MKDEGRATGGLDSVHDRTPQRPQLGGGRRSPYGYPHNGGGERGSGHAGPTYAALDLGTNNCRLLIARPTGDSFRVIDAFSRIIRLGEGVSTSGRISDAAICVAVEALAICRDKMRHRGVTRARLIATEACRSAANGGRIPRPYRRGGRARARDHRSRDRGDLGGDRLHAAARSATPTPCCCSTSAVAPPSWCVSTARRPPGAGRHCRRSGPGCRCRSAW